MHLLRRGRFPRNVSSIGSRDKGLGPIAPVAKPGVPNSKPLAFAVITVYAVGGGPEIARVTANAQGQFLLRLAPGTYRIVPLSPNPAYYFPHGIRA